MKSNVVFEAKIAIGLHRSSALLALSERPAPGFIYETENDEPFCAVGHDIQDIGVDDWIDYLPDVPKEPGIYLVKGAAYMIEDEGQYDKAEWEKLRDV